MARYDVFISYSSRDQKVVEGICGYLEARGIRCFVSFRDIPHGVVWAAALVEAIEESSIMLVAFSESFNQSKQVDREIELAAEDNKPILTFKLSDSKLKGAKKYYLTNLHWINAFPEPDKCFRALYLNICKLLGKTPIEIPSPQSAPVNDAANNKNPKKGINHGESGITSVEEPTDLGSDSGKSPNESEPITEAVSQVEEDVIIPIEEEISLIPSDEMEIQVVSEQGITNEALNNEEVEVAVFSQTLEETSNLQEKEAPVPVETEITIVPLTVEEPELAKTENYKDNLVETESVTEEIPVISAEESTEYEDNEEIEIIKSEAEESNNVERTLPLPHPIVPDFSEPTKPLPQPITPLEQTAENPVPMDDEHQWVDLGLPSGTKWATCNIGATKPEEYGEYFAWGDVQSCTSLKDRVIMAYKKGFEELLSLGIIDVDGNLTKEYDAATQNWGESWRMPTKEEIEELVLNTTDKWTILNGVKGKLLTSKINGNQLFLPGAGQVYYDFISYKGSTGYFWSSSVKSNSRKKSHSFWVMKGFFASDTQARNNGNSIRPVCK